MRLYNIAGILCLLLLCGCGEQREECQLDSNSYFLLDSLDMEFDPRLPPSADVALDATIVEMPSTGTSGHFLLRDAEGKDYRFEPWYEMDWEKQLDGLQLGRNYHFVFSVSPVAIVGMKVFDEGTLLYLVASYAISSADWTAFRLSGLEGFTARQLEESKCKAIEKVDEVQGTIGPNELIDLVTNLPVVFRYGERSVKLYPTEEVTFSTPQGEFLVHLLSSKHVEGQNYNGGGYFYSFYIKRL